MPADGLPRAVLAGPSNAALAAALLFAIFVWGGSNAAVGYLVRDWPPFWTGFSRMAGVGLVMVALLRWTRWFGVPHTPDAALSRALWWRGGLSLAVYVALFTCSLQFISVAHVAVYLGASPVWVLLMEGRAAHSGVMLWRYLAAALALGGVVVLFWPKLAATGGQHHWLGDALGFAAGWLWAGYSKLCRGFGTQLSGVEITAHTMWRAAVLLAPFAVWELATRPMTWRWDLVGAQAYCIVFGGLVAFGIWHSALRRWPASRVFLFNNLIPLTTMVWAWVLLDQPPTETFWTAMALVAAGVVLGQSTYRKSEDKPTDNPPVKE
ncbi:MAG: DMT family transporter [Pedosphaera sp.]|nr:DMT family transporter [Pedosphaera sp.]MSU42670.1 DMT family transporter [Pedosphaera sp.]